MVSFLMKTIFDLGIVLVLYDDDGDGSMMAGPSYLSVADTKFETAPSLSGPST
jgi:hypothetical protein